MTSKSLLLTVLVGFAFSASSALAQNLPTLTQKLASTTGEQTSVAKLGEGKVTVLSFWATWCKPCKEEMRAMFPMLQKFQGRVQYIAVSIDDAKTMAKVAPFVASKGYTMTVLLDPSRELFKAVNGTEVPYTLVFNADGTLHSKHDGFLAGDEVKLEQELMAMVGGETIAPSSSVSPFGETPAAAPSQTTPVEASTQPTPAPQN